MMRKCCVMVVLHCLCQGAYAQELSVESSSDSALALFDEARMAVHATWFEKADDLLRDLVEVEPELAISYGYLAVVDMFLYRNPSENAATALRLSEERGAGERDMTEILVDFAEGNVEDADWALWDFIDSYPDDRYARHLNGLILTDLGEGEEAIETLRELIRNYPDYVPAWNHLSNAFLETDRMEKAEAAAEMFLELSPKNPSAYDGLAEIRAQQGDIDQAVDLLGRAIELEPRMAFAWMHLGDILSAGGLPADAEVAYVNGLDSSILYGDEFRAELVDRIEEVKDLTESD